MNWLGISYCIKTSEIYLEDGKPVFVFAKQDNYHYNNKTHTMDYTPLKNVFEGRYYFDGNRLIQTIVKGTSTIPTPEVLSALKADMHLYPKLLFKELKKRKAR